MPVFACSPTPCLPPLQVGDRAAVGCMADSCSKPHPPTPRTRAQLKMHDLPACLPRLQVGDHAGIGCMVDSCGKCKQCGAGEEQYCKSCIYTCECTSSCL